MRRLLPPRSLSPQTKTTRSIGPSLLSNQSISRSLRNGWELPTTISRKNTKARTGRLPILAFIFVRCFLVRLNPPSEIARPYSLVGARGCIGRAGRRSGICSASIADKPREERRHFKRHLVTSRSDGDRSGLDHFHVVIPRVQLHASAQWQSGDLIELVRIQGRRRSHQRGHAFDAAFAVCKAVSQ